MTPYTLYLVTDDQQDLSTLCHVVKQAIAGGVSLVQVREKQGDVRTFIERAAAVKAVLSGSGVPLIINDRVDVPWRWMPTAYIWVRATCPPRWRASCSAQIS